MKKEIFLSRIEQLREIYTNKKSTGIIITKYHNLCWLGINRPNVLSISEDVVVNIIITDDNIYLVTNNIEIDRLITEEINKDIADLFTPLVFSWYGTRDTLPQEDRFITDIMAEDEIKPLRMIMSPYEMEQLDMLGMDLEDIVLNTLPLIKSDKTEREISSEIIKMCQEKAIDPGLALSASHSRSQIYRHPITTNALIGDGSMIALTCRRNGLYSCISRIILLNEPTEEILHKRDTVLAVDCTAMELSIAGNNVSHVLQGIKSAYDNTSYKSQWEYHHQGGITGYRSREEKLTFNSDIVIGDGMVFAYNPTVPGYKTEDTFYIKDGKKIITTCSEKLPTINFTHNGTVYKKPDFIVL